MALSRNKKNEQPNWRPNFRNPQALPDIKVVRTGFLLNAAALAFCLLVLGIWGYREYALASLQKDVARFGQMIDDGAAENRRLLQLDREFKKFSAALEEVRVLKTRFVEQSDLVRQIAFHQPREVVLSSFGVSPSASGKGKNLKVQHVLSFTGTVTDSATMQGPQIITEYRNALAAIPSLEPLVERTDLASFSRDEAQGLYNFTIRVVVNEPAQAE